MDLLSLTTDKKGPSQTQMEIELSRLGFCKLLSAAIAKTRSEPVVEEVVAVDVNANKKEIGKSSLKPVNNSKTVKGAASEPRATTRSGARDDDPPIGSDQYVVLKEIDVASLVNATYICDFGNIISGATKKKAFKVTNSATAGHMTWSIDKQMLAGVGFTVEPDKVQKLPEAGFVDYIVRFTARGMKVGKKQAVMAIQTKNAPTVNIVLIANVCVPEISVSNEGIDFEQVYLGRSRKITISLQNSSAVTAVWCLKKPTNGREEPKFVFSPSGGSIRAGKKVLVAVEFMPSEIRKYSLETLLKIENNPKSTLLTIAGEGLGTPLKFSPGITELGPILPFAPAGDVSVITVTSTCGIPLEFFSLDFDTGYRDEEKILSAIETYDEEDLIRSEPRAAAAGLPDEVQAAYAKVVR